ncbi:transcriptional regulator [Klebsiella sp. BIGb0407]|uniref:helix-turn-helix transcriptional regulator n=1 Tax=Klebsiella sp. BIGb0407 TaxID=2940603 RepID=UPI00216A3EB4|nr:PAS domain-containing protein [Klebsiella sp. BIGb0407]MCS3430442.1 putative transcriptional regulator YheO [Klebsiella sp. BIGb0407]
MSQLTEHQHLDELMVMLSAAVRVIGSVVSCQTEVVLHDLRAPEYSIAEIANAGVTGRKKGDSVLAGMRTDKAFISAMSRRNEPVSLLLDYVTYSREGKPLRSSTAIYRDRHHQPFAALCINVDNTGIEEALRVLNSLAGIVAPEHNPGPPEPAAENSHTSIEDLMHEIISTTDMSGAKGNRAETKRTNLLAVKNMQEKGIFLIKGGVEKAATALGVTRYTIYNYLDELNNEP